MKVELPIKIANFFTEHTKYKKHQIITIEEIHNGYTNQSFLVKTSDKKQYQVRLGNAVKIIDRANELNVLKLVKDKNFIYFNIKNGNAIKKWIKGHNPIKSEYEKIEFLNQLIKVIKKMHKVDINKTNVVKNEYEYYLKISKLDGKHYSKYIELLEKYDYLPQVLSHNDINPGNIIYCKNRVFLIDYEWGRINNEYWDLANFIREVMLPLPLVKKLCVLNPEFDFKILKDWIYISTNFALQWTHGMQQTQKILKYRKLCIKKMDYYYNLFFNSK